MTVDETSGFERLDEAAVSWGNDVRIIPGVYGGHSQPACVKIPVKFSPEKSQEPPDPYKDLLPPVEAPPVPLINPPSRPLWPPPEPIPLAPYPPVKLIPLNSKAG